MRAEKGDEQRQFRGLVRQDSGPVNDVVQTKSGLRMENQLCANSLLSASITARTDGMSLTWEWTTSQISRVMGG